jgi:DNA-binding PadR family transcriptional regulator
MARALGYSTTAILVAIKDGARYGLDIIERTRFPSGTVYPALSRLERRGYVTGTWEDRRVADREGRPRRRYYQITPDGRAALLAALQRFGELMQGVRNA